MIIEIVGSTSSGKSTFCEKLLTEFKLFGKKAYLSHQMIPIINSNQYKLNIFHVLLIDIFLFKQLFINKRMTRQFRHLWINTDVDTDDVGTDTITPAYWQVGEDRCVHLL